MDPEQQNLTPNCEKVFTIIYQKKLSRSKDGFVYAQNPHGKPQRLLSIPQTQCSSSEASASLIRKRSALVEKVLSSVSSTSNSQSNELKTDQIIQQTSLIKCKKETFVGSIINAGINIISKFDLKNVAAIKTELP